MAVLSYFQIRANRKRRLQAWFSRFPISPEHWTC